MLGENQRPSAFDSGKAAFGGLSGKFVFLICEPALFNLTRNYFYTDSNFRAVNDNPKPERPGIVSKKHPRLTCLFQLWATS
jgi:hypothetical protein